MSYSNYVEFEQHVAKLLKKVGWEVFTPKANNPAYDLIAKRGNDYVAVQVKWLKNNVQKPMLSTFVNFLESDRGKEFNKGFYITTKGFSGPARAYITANGDDTKKLVCGIATEEKILGIGAMADPPNPPREKVYIGVFTCKGGVGKTTIAAHLAGAFALQGFNVALVDFDPEQNLQKLVGDGVEVPARNGAASSRVDVFKGEDWHPDAARDTRIVVCDCSPAIERNGDIIAKFDYCIIPTTLNPLGLNKHGKVIKDTLEEIRNRNRNAHLFVVLNYYKKQIDGTARGKLLTELYLKLFQDVSLVDDRFTCINPKDVNIRESDQLYYWGMHLLEDNNNSKSELAFKLVGGKCYPREDFIDLADYIEREAGLGILRAE